MQQGTDRAERVAESYSMAEVVRETGIGEHTLRAWERRYSAVVPDRSDGGSRRYSAADIRRLRLLRRAVASGRRIGDVAKLDIAALEAQVEASDERFSPEVEALYAQAEALDAAGFRRALETHRAELTTLDFCERIVLPLLHALGFGWERGELGVACEHLASATLRNVLSDSLRDLTALASAPHRVVFATPPGERHELGSLAAATVAAAAGAHATFLGGDLPDADLIAAAKQIGASHVALGSVALAPARLRNSVEALLAGLPEVRLLIGGPGAAALSPHERCAVIARLGELEEALSST